MKTPWLPDFKIDWPNHIVAFFSALFGILIAFELDEWREAKKEQEVAMLAYEKLMLEIESNQAALHNTTDLNLDLLTNLQEELFPFLGDRLEFTGPVRMVDSINNLPGGIVFIEEVKFSGGTSAFAAHIRLGALIQPIQHYSAWESAKATGAFNYMPYERVQLLSSIYNSTAITDELQEIKSLLRTADQVRSKKDLLGLVDKLREGYGIIANDLVQYDMFFNMLKNG